MSEATIGRWCCTTCTFSNVSATRTCEMCQTPRMGVVGKPSLLPSGAPRLPTDPTSVIRSDQAAANYTNQNNNHHNHHGVGLINATSSPHSSITRTPSGVTLKSGEFQCSSCTFINTVPTAVACEVCGTPRVGQPVSNTTIATPSIVASSPSSSASPSSPSTTWNCPMCSLLNSMDAMRCVVCHTLSPLAPRDNIASASSSINHPSDMNIPRAGRGQVLPILQKQTSGEAIRSQLNPQVVGSPSSSAANGGANLSDAMLDPSGEREAAIQWQEIMSVCVASGNQFTDDSFRPGDRAIYGPGGAGAYANKPTQQIDSEGRMMLGTKQWGPFSWKRGRSCTKESTSSWCVLPFRADGSVDVKPSDIKQGELGDCWFLSALSVLCERPRLIEHLLLTQELNDVGAYQVRFCKNGQWRTITIDDYFPVNPTSGRLAFSHTPSNELWVPLIEKAYAKLHGSYAAIEAGSICDAFAELTGAPSERVELHSEEMSKFAADQMFKICQGDRAQECDILWATLLSFRQSGFLMGASCGRRHLQHEAYQAVGLYEDHAYAVLDARHENGVRFIQLRNPWGVETWRGDWSMNSPLWTPQWRKALNYYPHHTHSSTATGSSARLISSLPFGLQHSQSADVSHGCFWMSFTDFLNYFRTIDVCKYQEDWHVMRLKDEFPLYQSPTMHMTSPAMSLQQQQQLVEKGSSWTSNWMYELTVPASTWCFISLIQQDLRGTNAVKPYTYKSVGLFLLKSKTAASIETNLGGYQRCNEVFPETQRTVTCETLMTEPQGRYLIVPCSYAATIANGEKASSSSASSSANSSTASSSFPFVLCIYSSHPILVKRRPIYLPALTIAKQLATIRGDCKQLSEHCSLFSFECQGGLWYVVVNRHPTKYLSITVDCSGSEGLIPSRGEVSGPHAMKTRDYVPPRHRQLLLALVTPRASGGYSYERACSFMHVDGVSGNLHQPLLRRGYDIHQPVPIDHNFVAQIM